MINGKTAVIREAKLLGGAELDSSLFAVVCDVVIVQETLEIYIHRRNLPVLKWAKTNQMVFKTT